LRITCLVYMEEILMKTHWTKVANIGWLVAAILLVPLVLVSGAQAQKYGKYRVNGQTLTDQEKYILAQTEEGKIADLEKHGDRLHIRAKFLEILLTDGFPNFRIHRKGVRIVNAIIEERLDFEDAEIDYPFWLNYSTLKEGANLKNSRFQKILFLKGNKLIKAADFMGIKVGNNLYLSETTFVEQVNFFGAEIGGHFVADKVIFLNKKARADFSTMKVGQSAIIEKAVFHGPAGFVDTEIGGQLFAHEAKFLNRDAKVDFDGMKVGQSAYFVDTIFCGPVDFSSANIVVNFYAGKAAFLNPESKVMFNSIKVGQDAFFNNVEFNGPVDLTFSNFQSLYFVDVKVTKAILNGMSYKDIDVGGNWRKLLEMLNKSSFNFDDYRRLETYLLRNGNSGLADEVYIMGKRRELSQISWLNPGKIFTYICYDLMMGYGRKPGRLFLLWLNWVIVGAFIFNPKYLDDIDWVREATKYKQLLIRYLLSSDRFIPGLNLGLSKIWNPYNEVSDFTWLYWYLHRFLGWFLYVFGAMYISASLK
jgi:hypothetical protein